MMISLVGISHRTAPVALREQVSVRPSDVPAALQRIRAGFPDAEWVLLSTCNRTELYAAGVDASLHKDRLVGALLAGEARARAADLVPHFYAKRNRDAARHLFAVASSLDAMVVGETEILGQVKQALALAEEAGTAGKAMTGLFHDAFRTARRIHAETEICRGRVSVSSLAVEFIEKIFDDLENRTAMLVGAGETAELALKSLVGRGVKDVLVLTRSPRHGEDLARRCGGRPCRFEQLEPCLSLADIVISSTSAPHPVIGADAVRRVMSGRQDRPLLLMDIAVPRDVDPEAGGIENVHVCTIDDLRRVAAGNLARRRGGVEQAWRVVEDEVSLASALRDSAGCSIRAVDTRRGFCYGERHPLGECMSIHRIRSLVRDSAAVIAGLGAQAEAIDGACAAVVGVLRAGGKVLTAGNGGSAAEALHMAEELTGRFRGNRPSLPGICLAADPTTLTCIGNDFGFDAVFSRQVEGLGRAGDALVLFSTSGRAVNLSRALDAARTRGLVTVAFLGRDGGALAGRADHEIVVADAATERIQEAHQVLLHAVLDAVEEEFPAT